MQAEQSVVGKVVVRPAEEQDVPFITAIYGHYVLNATCTFELEPPDAHEMLMRFRKVKALGAPYLVAQLDDQVVGYAYAGSYRDRPAYRHTLENSVYVAPDFHARGLGRQLMEQLIKAATGGNFLQMVAVVGDSGNAASIQLHERLGFRTVGVLEDVGFKFGRWLNTVLMQRTLY
jgi:phosphinothricin acetyltransferase